MDAVASDLEFGSVGGPVEMSVGPDTVQNPEKLGRPISGRRDLSRKKEASGEEKHNISKLEERHKRKHDGLERLYACRNVGLLRHTKALLEESVKPTGRYVTTSRGSAGKAFGCEEGY